MTRNARTEQFRKEILEEYCLYLIEEYKKNPLKEEEIKHLFYDNFEYIYDNEELVEEADELGLIFWNGDVDDYDFNLSNHDFLQLTWIEKYPTKDWNFGGSYDYYNGGYMYNGISWNDNLELEWLERFPFKEWNWNAISRHPNFKLEWVTRFPNKPWDL
jgi:hypothetical protein